MIRRGLDRDELGFTLIETLAALLVFTIMTLGLVPLLLGSIRGSNVARSHTVGKNVVVQAMERVRGLPYYISYGTQPQRVDVLDFYYPNIVAAGAFTGQNYAGGTYTTVCTSTSTNPACPSSLPDDYTITYRVQFVQPNAAGTYDPKTPDPGYSWDLAGGGTDLFKTQLLQVVVEATWSVGPNARSFSMTSLVGDRKFGDIRTKGSAGIDYGIKALTTFIDSSGDEVELTASAGGAESRIESKLVSTADQTIEAGRLRLIRTPTAVDPTAVDVDVADAFYSTDHAPPDSALIDPDVGTVDVDLEASTVARLRPTGDVGRSVSAASELATAEGGFSYTSAPGTTRIVYVDTDTGAPSSTVLHLDTGQRTLVVRPPALGLTMSGDTYAETRVAGSGVVTTADMSFQELNLLPTEFISDTTNDRAVLAIDSFSANVTCDSTTDALSASASATYDATLKYWRDPSNDGVVAGSYVTLAVDETTDPTVLANLETTNALVYDGPTAAKDVYLFDKPAAGQMGYLTDVFNLAPTIAEDADGRETSATLSGALRIDTAPTNPGLDTSILNLSVGALTCEAVDRR